MPLYEYQCQACGQRFEVIHKFSDPPAQTCTKCGKGPVDRLASSPAIQFKGTGWYVTDYAKKSSTDATKAGTSSSETKSDSTSSDTSTKSDSASTPAAPSKTPST